MASLLGFHPPHFSEEAAWLPAWLQPSTIREDSNQEFECPSGQGLEEMLCLKQSTSDRESGNLSDDGWCKSFRLFLSGEDNSPMHFTSCSSNHEVRYNLRLSLNEESEYSLSPILSKSQAERFEFNQALPVHQPDAKGIPEEDIHEMNYNAVEAYMVPNQQRDHLGILGHEDLSLKEKKGIKPKVDARSLKVDVDDAVELAVAASEALTIHEVVKDEPSSELLMASTVLEAAMRVKQARLEDLEETLSCCGGECNDIDFLSDLDESTMADAYENVGLTVSGHGHLSAYESVSRIKDSYASESYMSNVKQKGNEPGCLEVDSGSILPKQQHKQVNSASMLLKRGLESVKGDTCKEQVDYAAVSTENADLACDMDPMLSCSVRQAEFCTTEVGLQREGFPVGDVTSSQTILRSVQSGSSGYNEREDKMTNMVSDRFHSRWFGGWTWKNEASIPAVTNHKYERCIHEPFANETSSLSESADITPDKNSCIQKQDNDRKIVSQSSVAPEGTYEESSNNGNLFSEDVAVSPCVSPMDPLCSVVPCSFTLDNACHQNVASQNCQRQVNPEKQFSLAAQVNLDNLKTISPQGADFLHGDVKSISKINGESSTVGRQVALLKTYSMLSLRCNPYLEKGLQHAPSVLSSVTQNPILDLRDDNDGHNPSHTKENTNLPMAINNGNTSRCISPDIGGEENLDRTVVPDSNEDLLLTKVKKFQTPETRVKDSLVASRICRALRNSNLQPKSRAYEVKRPRVTENTLFQNLKFLLTGFSVKKHKQIKNLIQKNGGIVLDDIPSPSTARGKKSSKNKCQLLPLILCPRRLLTTKFLYGCAVNASILKVNWLFDSVDGGLILPPNKYTILKEHATKSCIIIGKPVLCTYFIFENLAIMLHGKHKFCSKMAKIIKHGGGLVFKTFHWLVKTLDSKKVSVGAIVVEDENAVSRHLKQCAMEQKIPLMPFKWIINSLYAGRLLPSPEHKHSLPSRLLNHPVDMELSEEI
ncbi:uncharacterized protein LOC112519799 isoform X3 [Cynara cardunculus var. scolymus]|uniref:uncharacterized protein LOC112519799 isoform X3 n=1 Tax=Cynara cardunculus var. scolymus TaxID=59895 RepID=UPI000D626EF8|nr:uncharacterized protein LOC112519799 isoform X3 [Cynara cardunculus var. scolymus]